MKHTPTPRCGQELTHAHSHITRAVAAMKSSFVLIRTHPHDIAKTSRPTREVSVASMAATAQVKWLCAGVRYWPYRGVGSVCFGAEIVIGPFWPEASSDK